MDLVGMYYNDETVLVSNKPPCVIRSIQSKWPGMVEDYIEDSCFTLGNDYVELYDGFYVFVPQVVIRDIDGSFANCNLIMTIDIQNFEVEGKMCIRSANKDPEETDYKLTLDNAKLKMIVGIEMFDNTLRRNHCVYKLDTFDLSFSYGDDTKMSSFFDKINDNNERELLKLHLAECFTRNVGLQVECNVSQHLEDYTTDEDFGESCRLRNITATHVRRLHEVFNNLAKEIITLTNSLLKKESSNIPLVNLIGISQNINNQKVVKIYEGLICDLDSIIMVEGNNVIVTNENDLVIIDVPVCLQNFSLYYRDITPDKCCTSKSEFQQMQTYTSYDAYFCVALERLNQDKVAFAFKLRDFRIINLRTLLKYEIKMTVDYLIVSKIESSIKKCLEEALLCEILQALAISRDSDFDNCHHQLLRDSPVTSSDEL